MTTTHNCAECGVSAEPGQSFCDACGAVLSWKDRAPARPAAATQDEPAPRAGTADRATTAAAGRRPTLITTRPDPDPRDAATAPATTTATAPDTADAQDARVPEPEATAATAATSAMTPTAATSATEVTAVTPAGAGAPGIDDTAPTQPVRRATGPAPDEAPATDGEPAPVPAPDDAPRLRDEAAPGDPGARGGGGGDGMSERARRLLIPVADADPRPAAPPTVAPVLPGRPVDRRPQTVRAPGQELGADGGIPCPWCGTPNHPDRHYCTRCAMPMAADGHATGRRPWWRRIFSFGSQETPWAGDRPRLRRTFDRILTWLGVGVILALLITLAVNIPRGVQATKDHFAKRAPVAPDKVTASRSYPGHKPDLAFDKLNNTWWGPGITESGQGQWIEAKFTEPTRLLDLVITPGTSTRADQIAKSALPHRVKATVRTSEGKTETRELSFDQGAGGQRRPFRVKDAVSVRFTLETAYTASADKQVAIAEIEFFGPSNSSSS